MRKALFFLAVSSIVFASLILVFDRPTDVEAASPCREGYAIGAWDLPAGGAGSVEGKLIYQGQSVFALYADLQGSRTAGTLRGRLVDANGSTFAVVEGRYEGTAAGRGSFRATIKPPPFGSNTFEGKIAGEYEDRAGLPDPVGKFKAEWIICPN